tara:strand:- start:3525 stop:4868 length:1344 start_codon:yes stop_codon:yes gene_type:complete
MAFKIVNDTVIHNNTDVEVDKMKVLVGDGDPATPVLLQNVQLDGATVDLTQSLALIDTDDIAEGTTNLYFTEALAQGALASDIATLNTAITTGDANTLSAANTYTDDREDAITIAYEAYADAAVNTGTSALDTDDIPEGTLNLYYTDARADARATLRINAATTDNISEGTTNLYYTDARADARIAAATTDDLSEGTTNLYYTDARVTTYLNSNSITDETYVDAAEANAVTTANAYTDTRETAITTAYQTYTDTAVAGVVDSAPAVLDTLNELAAALGDDANFATTVSNDIGTKVSKAGDTMTGALTLSGAPTNANHAATKSYVDNAYTAGNGLSLSGTEFLMSGSYTGDFTASGDVCAYSDRALKRNIETLQNGLDKVMNMRGVTFQKDGKESLGVIAQEVEEVLPEVVQQDTHGMRSVAYGNIVGVLIEAIKEQQKQIEELKSKIK